MYFRGGQGETKLQPSTLEGGLRVYLGGGPLSKLVWSWTVDSPGDVVRGRSRRRSVDSSEERRLIRNMRDLGRGLGNWCRRVVEAKVGRPRSRVRRVAVP